MRYSEIRKKEIKKYFLYKKVLKRRPYLKAVVKIGGFIFSERDASEILRGYVEVFYELIKKKWKIAVVVGGGRLARERIEMAEKLGANNFFCDLIGMEAAKLNSMVFIAALKHHVYPKYIESIEEAKLALKSFEICFAGGMFPGQSTDAVAAILAEALGADIVVKCTSVDGVYTADPRRVKNAEKISKITYKDLKLLLEKLKFQPGSYELLDPVALKVLERSTIKLHICNGSFPTNILKILLEKKEVGTEVT